MLYIDIWKRSGNLRKSWKKKEIKNEANRLFKMRERKRMLPTGGMGGFGRSQKDIVIRIKRGFLSLGKSLQSAANLFEFAILEPPIRYN